MTRSIETLVEEWARLPWRVDVSRDPNDGALIARVRDLPATVATGSDEVELERDFHDAIRATLRCIFEAGEVPPLPQGVPQDVVRGATVKVLLGSDTWSAVPSTDGDLAGV